MKYSYLSEKLDSLEKEIHENLRYEINKSKLISKNYQDCKIIKVNIFDYVELGIINNRLMFLDKDGYQYSIDADCTLLDLIDILNQL